MSVYIKKNDVIGIIHKVEEQKDYDRKNLPYDAMIPDGYYTKLTIGRIMALSEIQIDDEADEAALKG